MKLRSTGLSDVGLKREANEDFFALHESAGLFVVADGLGGHVAGRVASELAGGRVLGDHDVVRYRMGIIGGV